MLSAEEDAWLAEVDTREKAATPGPWQTRFIYRMFDVSRHAPGLEMQPDKDADWPDAEFIAHARTDIPRMRALIDRLELELQFRENDNDELRRDLRHLNYGRAELDAANQHVKILNEHIEMHGTRIAQLERHRDDLQATGTRLVEEKRLLEALVHRCARCGNVDPPDELIVCEGCLANTDLSGSSDAQ